VEIQAVYTVGADSRHTATGAATDAAGNPVPIRISDAIQMDNVAYQMID